MNLPAQILGKISRFFVQWRGLAENTAWLSLDRGARLLVGITIGVLIPRHLGPSAYGQLSFATALTGVFLSISTLGLEGILVRNLVRNPEKQHAILGTALALRLFGWFSSFAFLLLGLRVFNSTIPDSFTLILVISMGSAFNVVDVIDFWFQYRRENKFAVIARTLSVFALAIVRLALLWQGASVQAFAWAIAGESAVTALALTGIYTLRGGKVWVWRWRFNLAREMLRDSWPLIFSNLMIMLYMRMDQIMLGVMRGESVLGVYTTAVRITEILLFLPMSIITATLPLIVEAKKEGEEVFLRRLQKLYNLVAFLSYAIILPLVLSSHVLIRLVFGEPFQAAGKSLAILAFSIVFISLGAARSSFLMTMNLAHIHAYTVTMGCAVNFLLNLTLIPRFGATGAAVATVLGYATAGYLSCFVVPTMHQTGRMLTQAIFLPRFWR